MNTKELGESSFNMTRGGMKILRGGGGAPKSFRHPKGGSEKTVGLGGGGSENLYSSKPTHDIIIIQIGWFSTQQFNDPCNLAISCGFQI